MAIRHKRQQLSEEETLLLLCQANIVHHDFIHIFLELFSIIAESLQLYLNEFCYKFKRRHFGFRLFEGSELCACSYRAEFKLRIY